MRNVLSGQNQVGEGLQHLGRWRSGQDQTVVAKLHPLHGCHHLRGGLQRQGQDGGGQAGAAEDRQINGAIFSANPRVGEQARPAPGSGFAQAGEGAGPERSRSERGVGGEVVLCRYRGGAGGGLLQPPGAHRQEKEDRESSALRQQGETKQESSAITQPPFLVWIQLARTGVDCSLAPIISLTNFTEEF